MEQMSDKTQLYIDEVVQEYLWRCTRFSLDVLDIDMPRYDVIDNHKLN
ncbi:hypothetical protein [Intestinibacter sp.]